MKQRFLCGDEPALQRPPALERLSDSGVGPGVRVEALVLGLGFRVEG